MRRQVLRASYNTFYMRIYLLHHTTYHLNEKLLATKPFTAKKSSHKDPDSELVIKFSISNT